MKPLPVQNPLGRFRRQGVEYDQAPLQRLELFQDSSKSILSKNNSPDVGFKWSVNPYRGCSHGCAYCYARPSHEYLGFQAGSDFDRKLLVKGRAMDLLDRALLAPSWKRELIVFSGNTDCYQPIEATHELTRACLKVCLRHQNPVSVITKSALIERDADVFQDFIKQGVGISVRVSVPFWDARAARCMEPQAPTPERRFRTIRFLSSMGIPVGVHVAPVIPGLTDQHIPRILQAARDAGAKSAAMILLRLPGSVRTVFWNSVEEHFADRADKIRSALRSCRGGAESDARYGRRFSGEGKYAEALERLFEISARRLGLETGTQALPESDDSGRASPLCGEPQLGFGFR